MDKPPIESLFETTALHPEARVDPYPTLRQVQAKCPVFHDAAGVTTFVSRYADVRGVVSDHSLWRSGERAEPGSLARRRFDLGEPIPERPTDVQSILTLDEPDHMRIRAPLAQALYARAAKLKPEIEAMVGELMAPLARQERFDLISAFAIPLPVTVIARILGVDEARLDDFRRWSEKVITFVNPFLNPQEQAELAAASEALGAYFHELMAARRLAPKDDLVSDMVKLQADGAPLTDNEIRINLTALLIGGNLTTTDLIGNGVWLLLNHPEQRAKLTADPSLAAATVEEVLRFESPVDVTGRIASRAMEVGGCSLPTHRSILVSLRAANRDPEIFPDPDRFDISRKAAPHLAFGGGLHICIGAPLARLEARAVFAELFQRLPDLRLEPQELAWRRLPFFRGLEQLWLANG